MKLTINQRLFDFLENQQISNVEFQRAISVKKPQQISSWKSLSEPIPKDHILNTIAFYGKLNGHWLLTGDGNMLNEVEKIKYAENNEDKPDVMKEPKITTFSCTDCIEKERTIQAQKKTIDIQDRYIASLEVGHTKNGEAV